MLNEIKHILARNPALRLLLKGQYRWIALALLLAASYFVLGLAIAVTTKSLLIFIQVRAVYVLPIAIIACVAAACWYPSALADVIAIVPTSFRVDTDMVSRHVSAWMRLIRLPFPFTFGLLLASGGVVLTLTKGLILGLSPALPQWLLLYISVLIGVCGLILGGGVIVFLATMWLFNQLFKYELRLSHFRSLAPLSTFSTGLTVLALFAVALLLLLIFDQIRPISLVVVGIGTLGGILMFIVAQYSYQGAITRAKRAYLKELAPLYEQYYQMIVRSSDDIKCLQSAKDGLEALDAVEKNIKAIPIWLVELSDIIKIAWSSLAPLGSLLVNLLLSRLSLL